MGGINFGWLVGCLDKLVGVLQLGVLSEIRDFVTFEDIRWTKTPNVR